MGTWGTEPFESDAACDLLFDLEQPGANFESILQEGFARILKSPGTASSGHGEYAIAAAYIVMLTDQKEEVPERVVDIVPSVRPSIGLISQAISAVDSILTQSELKKVSRGDDDWERSTTDILNRLRLHPTIVTSPRP